MPRTTRYLLLASLWMGCATSQETAPAVQPPAVSEQAPAKEDLRGRQGKMLKELRALVADLKESGRYDCCIKEPCSHCAMMAGGCSCGEGLRRGEPVCEECALMWVRGLGDETGVDPATVRSFLEAERVINAEALKSAKSQRKHGKGHKH